MGGWTESYERLCLLDQVSPLEPAQLIELAISAYQEGSEGRNVATGADGVEGRLHSGSLLTTCIA